MSSEIEAAGAAITAGIAARTIEGKDGAKTAAHGPCANCGAEVNGNYCAACGQAGHVHRTLGHFIEEALHGVFHFDTKAWRTLPMLFGRPGTLTRRYTMGERARYISPIALFLFTVFLMFFVFALMGQQETPATRTSLAERQQDLAEAQEDLADARARLAEARTEVEAARTAGEARPGAEGALGAAETAVNLAQAQVDRIAERISEIEARAANLRVGLAQLEINEVKARAENDADALQSIEFAKSEIQRALNDPAGPPEGLSAEVKPDGDVTFRNTLSHGGAETIFEQIREANARGQIDINTGVESWNEKIKHKLENPELAWYKIQNTAYKFSFLLIPISLPFVWLMFAWKRGTTLFDHSVFVLYSLSFVSMLLIVLVVLARTWPAAAEVVGPFVLLALPAHMFFQLKGGYTLGVFSALWRTVYLMLAALFSLIMFLFVIMVLGLLG